MKTQHTPSYFFYGSIFICLSFSYEAVGMNYVPNDDLEMPDLNVSLIEEADLSKNVCPSPKTFVYTSDTLTSLPSLDDSSDIIFVGQKGSISTTKINSKEEVDQKKSEHTTKICVKLNRSKPTKHSLNNEKSLKEMIEDKKKENKRRLQNNQSKDVKKHRSNLSKKTDDPFNLLVKELGNSGDTQFYSKQDLERLANKMLQDEHPSKKNKSEDDSYEEKLKNYKRTKTEHLPSKNQYSYLNSKDDRYRPSRITHNLSKKSKYDYVQRVANARSTTYNMNPIGQESQRDKTVSLASVDHEKIAYYVATYLTNNKITLNHSYINPNKPVMLPKTRKHPHKKYKLEQIKSYPVYPALLSQYTVKHEPDFIRVPDLKPVEESPYYHPKQYAGEYKGPHLKWVNPGSLLQQ